MQNNGEVKKILDDNLHLRDSLDTYERFLGMFGDFPPEASKESEYAASVVNRVSELFCARRVSFLSLEPSKAELLLQASKGLPEDVPVKIPWGQMFAGWVAREGKPMLVVDVDSEYPAFPGRRSSSYSSKSFMIAPVRVKGEVCGIINVTDKDQGGNFGRQELKLLEITAAIIGLGLENLRLNEKNQVSGDYDPLTGVRCHRKLLEELSDEIYRCERYRSSLSLVVFDIDNFGLHNQSHGYAAGDYVLKGTASLISQGLRQADFLGRYQADEFLVILPETKLKDAVVVAGKVKDKIREAVFTEDEKRKSALGMFKVTVSAGVAEHKLGLNVEDLVSHALSALAQAKKDGQDKVAFYKY